MTSRTGMSNGADVLTLPPMKWRQLAPSTGPSRVDIATEPVLRTRRPGKRVRLPLSACSLFGVLSGHRCAKGNAAYPGFAHGVNPNDDTHGRMVWTPSTGEPKARLSGRNGA